MDSIKLKKIFKCLKEYNYNKAIIECDKLEESFEKYYYKGISRLYIDITLFKEAFDDINKAYELNKDKLLDFENSFLSCVYIDKLNKACNSAINDKNINLVHDVFKSVDYILKGLSCSEFKCKLDNAFCDIICEMNLAIYNKYEELYKLENEKEFMIFYNYFNDCIKANEYIINSNCEIIRKINVIPGISSYINFIFKINYDKIGRKDLVCDVSNILSKEENKRLNDKKLDCIKQYDIYLREIYKDKIDEINKYIKLLDKKSEKLVEEVYHLQGLFLSIPKEMWNEFYFKKYNKYMKCLKIAARSEALNDGKEV